MRAANAIVINQSRESDVNHGKMVFHFEEKGSFAIAGSRRFPCERKKTGEQTAAEAGIEGEERRKKGRKTRRKRGERSKKKTDKGWKIREKRTEGTYSENVMAKNGGERRNGTKIALDIPLSCLSLSLSLSLCS